MLDLNTGVEQEAGTPPVQEDNTTKIVAERIKAGREKDRAEIAKAMGFESWDKYLNSGVDKKLVDAGIDPEMAKPVINEMVENHPEVIEARRILAEAQIVKKSSDIQLLNATYGTTLESYDKLDDQTKALIAKGIPLEQAYVAIHFKELKATKPETDPIKLAEAQKRQSLSHMKTIPGNGTVSPDNIIVVSQSDTDNVKRFMSGVTTEQIKTFLVAHPELKNK